MYFGTECGLCLQVYTTNTYILYWFSHWSRKFLENSFGVRVTARVQVETMSLNHRTTTTPTTTMTQQTHHSLPLCSRRWPCRGAGWTGAGKKRRRFSSPALTDSSRLKKTPSGSTTTLDNYIADINIHRCIKSLVGDLRGSRCLRSTKPAPGQGEARCAHPRDNREPVTVSNTPERQTIARVLAVVACHAPSITYYRCVRCLRALPSGAGICKEDTAVYTRQNLKNAVPNTT